MGLENKALSVKIVTIEKIEYRPGIGYEIFVEAEDSKGSTIPIGNDGKNLVRRLFPGDKLFAFVDENENVREVYGPVEEDKLYNYKNSSNV